MTRQKLALILLALQYVVVCSGCRTASSWNSASKQKQPSATRLLAVDRSPESSEVALVNDESGSPSESRGRFWERLKPKEVISFPRTDFWSGESATSKQSTGFETGF